MKYRNLLRDTAGQFPGLRDPIGGGSGLVGGSEHEVRVEVQLRCQVDDESSQRTMVGDKE